jgi:proline dehydrogenase
MNEHMDEQITKEMKAGRDSGYIELINQMRISGNYTEEYITRYIQRIKDADARIASSSKIAFAKKPKSLYPTWSDLAIN